MPPPSALPSRYTSGTTPSRSHANVVPTRPRPDWISSAMNRTLCRVQISRTAVRYPSGGTTTPASPWIGSRSTAAVEGVMAASIAAASPYGTVTNPGANGPKSVASLRVVAEADDRRRAAVEVAVRDDDGRGIRSHALDPVRPRARDLDAGLDRFGAGVHRKHEVLLAQPRERLGELREPVVVEGPAREREAPELLGRGGDESRMPVAEVEGRVGGQQVEVALALDIRHPRALGARDDDRKRVVVAGDVLVVGSDDADRRGVEHRGLRGGHGEFLQLRSSRVQHLMPPPPSSSSDRSTRIGL